MHIRQRDLDAVSRLWGELSEFSPARSEEALTHCLQGLMHIVGAANAAWLAAVQDIDAEPEHPTRGWWPRDIVVLHDAEENARLNEAVLTELKGHAIDPQSAAMIASAGRARAQLRAAVLDDDGWRRSWLYQEVLRPLHMEDRLVGARPVDEGAESYFALDRGRNDRAFDESARDLLALFLAGCPTFHRRQLRIRGLVDASRKLSPREQSVLKLLLTDKSEAEIADTLGLAVNTTHQYVMSVYRKFGVRGRAALAARWL